MKSLALIIAVLVLSSCAENTHQAHQANIQKHKTKCLQAGLKERTDAFSECLSLTTYQAQATEKAILADISKLSMQQQQLEILQEIALQSRWP